MKPTSTEMNAIKACYNMLLNWTLYDILLVPSY